MFRRISNWLYSFSKGRVALTAFVFFFLFSILVLPGQAQQAEQVSGGSGSPDTSLFYTPSELYAMAEAYGEAGRQAYVRARFTFDLLWPVVYTLFLVTAISWSFQQVFPTTSPWVYANLAPLLAMLFDLLENISTSIVMLRYPEPTPVVVWLAPVFTLVKWIFVGGSFVLLVIGLIAAGLQWLRGRGKGG